MCTNGNMRAKYITLFARDSTKTIYNVWISPLIFSVCFLRNFQFAFGTNDRDINLYDGRMLSMQLRCGKV